MPTTDETLCQKISEALNLIYENRELAEQIRRRDEAEAREKRREAEYVRVKIETERLEAERNQLEAEQKRLETERNQLAQESEKKDAALATQTAEINALRAKLAQLEADRGGN